MNVKGLISDTDIVFITLDSLRYDVAQQSFLEGMLPHFATWLGEDGWEERYSPASFTFPAHHAFFSGFLPTKIEDQITPRLFSAQFNGSESTTENTFTFPEANIVEALHNKGYQTICIGGVGFFNKENAVSSVFPNLFDVSEWSEKLGVTEKESTKNQFELATQHLKTEQPVFLFINVSATHQPTNIYLDKTKADDLASHKASLLYVDSQLPILKEALKKRGRDQLVIICSDHGTAYGEDEHWGHRNGHEVVMKVPYLEYLNRA